MNLENPCKNIIMNQLLKLILVQMYNCFQTYNYQQILKQLFFKKNLKKRSMDVLDI